MEPQSYLSALASEGASLAEAAEGHLDRPVPSCPAWDVAQLVAHAGSVYGWTRMVVAARGERIGPRQAASDPPGGPKLLEWYRDELGQTVEALSIDPDTPAWTFAGSGPGRVGWWCRRQALETAVHRWDVQAAATGRADPVVADLAVAGIDEMMEFLPGILASRSLAGLQGSFHAHATDAPGEWWLDFDTPGLAARREHAKADTALRGPASGLYLWMWNRQSPEEAGLEAFGRRETIDAWRTVTL
jgi:uncharacterized protein (TIGR03083 family)